MEVSKIGALYHLLLGGWSGLANYILEAVNSALKKLDPLKLAEFAGVVGNILAAIKALAPLLPAKYAGAVTVTVVAVDDLAKALADGKVTDAELDCIIDGIEAAVAAWKEAK